MNKKAFEYFSIKDKVLYSICIGEEEIELKKSEDLFLDLVDNIISQQLSVKASASIVKRLVDLLGGEITPEKILKTSTEDLRGVGLSGGKVKYVKDLSQKIIDRDLELEALGKLENEEVIKELVKVKGIGRWTAEMFLISSLGREDVFSYGDLGLRRAIQKVYGLEKEPSQEEAETVAACWSPYRSYACKLLWRSLKNS